MKKGLLVALILALCTVSLSAAPKYKASVGAIFGVDFLSTGNTSTMLTFRLPKFPPVFSLGAYIPTDGGNASFALMADWWILQTKLVNFLNLYLGPGLYTGISGDYFHLGLRFPVGINAFPINPLELFFEIAPAIRLVDKSGFYVGNFGLQAGLGFRFWF